MSDESKVHDATGQLVGQGAKLTFEAKVKRGERSSNVLLIFLGFALTIGGSAISMLDELLWWARLSLFIAYGAFASWAFLDCGWWQNKVIGWHSRNADKER